MNAATFEQHSLLAEGAVLYLLIGAGCALAFVLRSSGARHPADAALLLAVWPLYAPFLLSTETVAPGGGRRSDFLEAIQRASGTPLASLLPSAETAAGLNARVVAAEHRVAEIEHLLSQPDFDEGAALTRSQDLEARGESLAASIAATRARNIRQLVQLRDRFRRELSEINELLAQLRLQAELVRLAGAADGGSREVVQTLLARVDGLGAILEEEGAQSRS
jgi:hypothetical protein